MNKNRQSLKDLYKLAKDAKVGETVRCPSCLVPFEKTNYQQAFCKFLDGTVCKDNYWNNVTPTKRNNKTRISPASLNWLAKNDKPAVYGYGDSQREIDRQDRLDEELNCGDDGLDVTVERCQWCECLRCRCED